MKTMVMMVVALVAGVGGVLAAPLTGMQAWAAKAGTNDLASYLAVCGLTNAAKRADLTATWDESVLVDTALRNRAYGLISLAMTNDKLTSDSTDRVKASILAETEPPVEVLDLVAKFPVAERQPFRAVVEAAGAVRYATQPEYGRLQVEYALLRGFEFVLVSAVSEEDLVRYLLAPESLPLQYAEYCKKAIKDRAVILARLKLRAEGKSFVVKDGVNPLVARLQPVVEALNAPECAGLEGALRDLGSTVQDMDRKPMRELVAGWQPKMMAGEMGTGDFNQALGKTAVALGVDAYNRFVDAYNNGTAGAK